MCNFFSCIALSDGRIVFTEATSHEIVILRAGLRDENVGPWRTFMRLEVSPPYDSVDVDEYGDVDEWPGWFNEQSNDFHQRAIALAQRIAPAYELYRAEVKDLTNARNAKIAAINRRREEAYAPLRRERTDKVSELNRERDAAVGVIFDRHNPGIETARKAWTDALHDVRERHITEREQYIEAHQGADPPLDMLERQHVEHGETSRRLREPLDAAVDARYAELSRVRGHFSERWSALQAYYDRMFAAHKLILDREEEAVWDEYTTAWRIAQTPYVEALSDIPGYLPEKAA